MDPLPQIAMEHARCSDPEHPYPLKWGDSRGWALHLRRTSPMLSETLKEALKIFPQIDPNVKPKTTSGGMEFRFASGYQIDFSHCKDPDDWLKYQSNSYTHIVFDELIQFTEEQYDQITARLRSPDPVLGGSREFGLPGMLRIRSASNPVMQSEHMEGVAAHDRLWVRRRFIDPWPSGERTFFRMIEIMGKMERWDWIYLPAKLTDNPDPNFIRSYMLNLKRMPKHIAGALLEGNWYLTARSYFGDVWSDRIHVCRPFRISGDWPVFRSMDWGFKKPGCVHWWALDRDSNLFCIREYTFQGKDAGKVAEEIIQIEKEMGFWDKKKRRSLLSGPADTQIWENRGDVAKTKAEEMAAKGVMWVAANKNGKDFDRAHNAQRVHKRLADYTPGETPGLVIFEDCKDLIRTIPSLQAQHDNPEAPADGGEDHWMDSCFYACAYASYGRAMMGKRRKEDEYEDDDKRLERAGKAGSNWGYGEVR